MGSAWAPHGLRMGSAWAPHGLRMGLPWACHGLAVAKHRSLGECLSSAKGWREALWGLSFLLIKTEPLILGSYPYCETMSYEPMPCKRIGSKRTHVGLTKKVNFRESDCMFFSRPLRLAIPVALLHWLPVPPLFNTPPS